MSPDSGKMIYVASPFTHDDEAIKEYRKQINEKVCSHLIKLGYCAISPIVYGCTLIDKHWLTNDDFTYWESFCLTLLKKSDIMYVLRLDGWAKSMGVFNEINFAWDNSIPIMFIDPIYFSISEFIMIR
jgi:hypothetical protein